MNETMDLPPTQANRYTRAEQAASALFWSWNVIFLAFMLLGFAPVMLPEIFTAVRDGSIPAPFLAYGLILTLIPIAAVILGLTILRRKPNRQLALGYVVEGPLMLLLAVRLFLIRQATPAVSLIFAIALLGLGAFLWHLLDSQERRLGWLRLGGLTLMALVSIYAASWMAFYAIPLGAELLRTLNILMRDFLSILRDWMSSLIFMLGTQPYMILFSLLGWLLILYTASLLFVAPLAVPYLSLRAWWRSLNQQAGQTGWITSIAIVAAVIGLCLGSFFWANQQPQKHAFALLEKPPATMEEAQSLIEQSSAIRAGLLNAYLAPFRYLSAVGEVTHIRNIYEYEFGMPLDRAFAVQRMYEGLARPLLYNPVHPQRVEDFVDNHALTEEPRQAARLYQRFFDTPITDGERETIVAAVRSTWQADEAEAAWLAVDDREVHLVRQEIQVSPQGDWAELELHEVYQNQTTQEQEVIYYFNLPESAVITGLWLGNSPDKSRADAYQVAPRGAAQAVYREQTRVIKDPALVEQIGPRQYRLRVYPVPPRRFQYDERGHRTLVHEALEQHVWLAWREFASQDGKWPLPRLAFLRNVYWDRDTLRLVGDQQISGSLTAWLPDDLSGPQPAPPASHRVDLPSGRTVLAVPAGQVHLPDLPAVVRLAVVLDRSRSMEAYANETAAVLNQLKASNASADVYLTSSPYRGEEPSVVPLPELAAGDILYFGGQNAAQLLAQYDQLSAGRQYDAVIVLTDGSGYELGDADVKAPVPQIPVWLIHLNGDLSLGYDDQTLDAIQASGGGVAGDIDTVLERLAISLDPAIFAQVDAEAGGYRAAQDLVDGYVWLVASTDQAEKALAGLNNVQSHSTSDPFAALAARRYILSEMQANRGTIDQLDTLDYLHALAVDQGIVTPFSSMIVLVDAQQQKLLDQLSSLEDRYQREVEALGDTSPASPVPLTGVPEPHEWLLLALAAAMLVYLGYRRYSSPVAVRNR